MKLMALILLVAASYSVNAQCSAPTDLTTSPITAMTGTAHWAPVSGALNYDVEFKPASSSNWIVYLYHTTGLQCIFSSGVEPNTTYDWRVKANCASGSSSYSQTQFITGPIGTCVAPGGLYATNISSTIATVNWSPVSVALSYAVLYKPASSGSWLYATTGTFLTNVTIYGLTPGTTYDWVVVSNCSLYESSSFSVTSQFTTSGTTIPPPTGCPGIYDVSTNGTPGGAAVISLNTDVKGTVAPKNDIDHYKFTITTGGTITVSLTTLPANYDLAVLNSIGTQIGISKNKSSKNESISLNVAAGTYYAKVIPVGTANSATSCYTLKVQTGTASRNMATATEENANPGFSFNIFPNPAGDQLNVTVKGVDRNADIKVYNLMGKLIMQRQTNTMLTQLDISKLPAGIYLLNVNNGTEIKAAKFVKQ
jgi:Secretion system C-terminal sorting domain/Bacterial pre-peptidase C-terminal domain/Fibronectin type III domain